MFSLGNCAASKGTYNIFGSEHPHRRASYAMMDNINYENYLKATEDGEELLKELKENIDSCDRTDFETEEEYHLELKRRMFMYSSTKEIIQEKKRHLPQDTIA